MMDPDTFSFKRVIGRERVAVARAAVQECGGIASASDLGKRWGVTKGRVNQLVRLDGFPEPLSAPEGSIPRWLVEEADAWRKETT